MKTANWLKAAYQGTVVDWAKTQTQIMKMLGEVGIDQIRFTSLNDRFVLEFMAQLDERSIPKAVRIIIPLGKALAKDGDKKTKELNVIHRILLQHLKAKFVAIANGLTEFEQEFMSHLVITDKSGNTTTMGEMLLPQYQKNLEDKTTPKFMLGEGNS